MSSRKHHSSQPQSRPVAVRPVSSPSPSQPSSPPIRVKPRRQHFSVLLPPDLLAELREASEREERNASEIVRLALKAYLRK